MLTTAALKNGFTGGVIVDYPNSKKAKKYFLFLIAGYSEELMAEAASVIPKALEGDREDEEEKVAVFDSRRRGKSSKRKLGEGREMLKSRNWVMAKKERQRRQGRDVRMDSKYTGRKRNPAF